ncbi:MAG: anthranilate phosphoribosyltransferase family protein [Prochlorotrichaceae cyanobacterium]|jgi:anthranilate phosphoribosyltransferase
MNDPYHPFRDLLKKIAGGPHTSKDLSREEAAMALELMLTQRATPAQIGAFLIAHRMKRPTGTELAGMLDTYDRLGCQLAAIESPVLPLVLGCPYDGRSRTFPLVPLTALILAAAGCPVILHGGDRMPPKYGVSLLELWQALGLDWSTRSWEQVQDLWQTHHLGFVYIPQHFPLACCLIDYREQLGKRPPVATLELMWSPYAGSARIVVGYVHPPTEQLIVDALHTRGVSEYLMVKGLEGSVDLPGDRPAIVKVCRSELAGDLSPESPVERLRLHPDEYSLKEAEIPFKTVEDWSDRVNQLIQTPQEPVLSHLYNCVCWNGGFYLWQSGIAESLEAGIAATIELLKSGQVAHYLNRLRKAFSD